MTENEKTTALIPSVGADGGQPPHNSTYQSIPHETCESNPPEENIEEMRERIRRMNDPHYLDYVESTLGGLMLLVLKNGCKECISRKYLPAFKKYLGL